MSNDKLKTAAGTAAGMAAGAAAAYAAENVSFDEILHPQSATEEQLEEETADPTQVEPQSQEKQEEEHHTSAPEPAHHHEQGQHGNNAAASTGSEHHSNNYLDQNDVRITDTTSLDSYGVDANVAHGTVNGHEAVFVDDGQGHVMDVGVDLNDNGMIDPDEITQLADQNITMDQVTAHAVEGADVQVTSAGGYESSQVEVISVEHDVDLNGHMVDIAEVTDGSANMYMVDVNQDGDTDFVASDVDHNGNIDNGELQDVSNLHVAMPTETGNMGSTYAGDDTPDYSNDADVQLYDA